MPSRSRKALNEIRRLLRECLVIKKDGMPADEFKKFLDTDDPYFEQIIGDKHVR